jgi:hypothetical protein
MHPHTFAYTHYFHAHLRIHYFHSPQLLQGEQAARFLARSADQTQERSLVKSALSAEVMLTLLFYTVLTLYTHTH